MRMSIKKRAHFDLRALELLEMANQCYIPALFVHGEYDTFVRPQHSEDLYSRYGGDKNRIVVDGDHNSMRPQFFMDSAVIFFNNTLYSGDSPRPPLVLAQNHNNTSSSEHSSLLSDPELSAEEVELILESEGMYSPAASPEQDLQAGLGQNFGI